MFDYLRTLINEVGNFEKSRTENCGSQDGVFWLENAQKPGMENANSPRLNGNDLMNHRKQKYIHKYKNSLEKFQGYSEFYSFEELRIIRLSNTSRIYCIRICSVHQNR